MAEPTNHDEPISALPKGGTDLSLPLEGLADPSSNLEASSALDDLLKEAQGDPTELSDEDKQKKAEADAAAAEEAKKKEEERQAALTEEQKKKEVDDAAAKAAKEAAEGEKLDFEKVELPPYTKPKAAEAFAAVKLQARAEVVAARKQADEWKTKAEAAQQELQKRPASGLSDDEKKEVEELRKFRQQMDVEADPSFKEWDTKVNDNLESIYTKLKASGLTDDQIKKVKELGVAEVDWKALDGKLPERTLAYITAKLVENEDLGEKKAKAIATAKANAAEFLKTRQQTVAGNSEEIHKQAKQAVDAQLGKMDWLKPKQVPAGAKPEEKAAIEKVNAENEQLRADIEAAIKDDSAELKSALLVGYAQLRRERAVSAETEAKHKAEVEKLTAKVTELETKLLKIKGASTTRLRDSGAPSKGEGDSKKTHDINEAGGDALDRHLAEVRAAQE